VYIQGSDLLHRFPKRCGAVFKNPNEGANRKIMCDELRRVTQSHAITTKPGCAWFGIWKRAVFENSAWHLADAVLENGAADRAPSCVQAVYSTSCTLVTFFSPTLTLTEMTLFSNAHHVNINGGTFNSVNNINNFNEDSESGTSRFPICLQEHSYR
jgi:hypothetical protein